MKMFCYMNQLLLHLGVSLSVCSGGVVCGVECSRTRCGGQWHRQSHTTITSPYNAAVEIVIISHRQSIVIYLVSSTQLHSSFSQEGFWVVDILFWFDDGA